MDATRVCSIDGCDTAVKARGWCDKHYLRWRRTGNPEHVRTIGSCSIDGCNGDLRSSGLCNKHYLRWKRHGDPFSTTRFGDAEESFSARTRRSESGCTEWTGAKVPDGYGVLRVKGKATPAHRYAWERVNGPIPQGLLIDHVCWNRACCNVDHLRLATVKQNAENRKGPQKNSKSGIRGAVYSPSIKKWVATIKHDGKVMTLGYYTTSEEAGRVAARERARLFTHSQN